MSARFVVRHAVREARGGLRRMGPYLLSITLGVGALVAIHSFRAAVADAVKSQSRELLGGDARLASSQPFSSPIEAVLDSLQAAGATVARVTTLPSMVSDAARGTTRLLQVRAVTPEYPLVGLEDTEPADAWARMRASGGVVAEPAVLLQLGASIGDTLAVGYARLPVVGTVSDAAPESGFRSALGPRVYIRQKDLEATGLVTFGSLASYDAFLALPPGGDAAAVETARDSLFRAERVDYDTADERARGLTRALDALSRFLGLVGLTALLLGGIGVGSAVRVYVREKIPDVAVLRCIGATQRTLFLAYLLQAVLLGLVGSAAGVVLGIAVQPLIGVALASSLPVRVGFHVDALAVLVGLLTGVWVAGVFAVLPMLEVRGVAPLQALRRDFESVRVGRATRVLAWLALGASVLAISVWQAPTARIGAAYTAAMAVALGVLAAAAWALARVVRRLFPRRASFAVRQGIANLFRPRNQTLAVTLALGFGVFVIAALLVVQSSVLARFRPESGGPQANLLLFDVQPGQRAAIDSLLGARGLSLETAAPIVPGRVAALRGRPTEAWMADTVRQGRPARWALRREYRNTYRDSLTDGEQLVAGTWFDGRRTEPVSTAAPARVSLETGVAEDLGVSVGDTIVWDVAGARIPSVVTSLRTVDWARFEPNFFAVFEPGVLESAPQMVVALASVQDDSLRARVQVDLVRRFPGISILDLDQVQKVVARITARAAAAVRFLGGIAIAAGLVVLFGAVASSRQQRLRESALLKAIGADRRRIRSMLLTEYAALGLVASVAGGLLGVAAGWLMADRVFELPVRVPVVELVALAVGVGLLTGAVGVLNARDVVRRPPLAVLREAAELA